MFCIEPITTQQDSLTDTTKIHIRTLLSDTRSHCPAGGSGGGGGAVPWYFWYFWYVRQFSKSDNTNQHNGQQCGLAGGAHWNVDNQQLFTSRLPGPHHSFLLFCRVWSFYYYFKIPCNQFCQTWAGGRSRNKFPLRLAGCLTDPPTAPLCSLAGRGRGEGRGGAEILDFDS